MPWLKIWRWARYGLNSEEEERAWIWGFSRSSANTKVPGAEVARLMRSAAARGDVADLLRIRKGYGGSFVS